MGCRWDLEMGVYVLTHTYASRCDLRKVYITLYTFCEGVVPKRDSKLINLDISHNSFVGALPTDVSSLRQTYEIDRSSNFFVGRIPESFEQLNMLTYLNISYNLFEGSISGPLKK